jgi:ABC-2 type transport system permease protein
MTAFLALVWKDLQLFLRDPRAIILSFLAPILIGSFFGYIFGGSNNSNGERARTRVLFVDLDKGPVSLALQKKLAEEKTIALEPATEAQARELVRKGKAPVAIVLPPDFSKEAGRALLISDNKPEVRLLLDPSHQVEGSMIKGLLAGGLMQVVMRESFGGTMTTSVTTEALQQLDGVSPKIREQLRDFLQSAQKLQSSQTGSDDSSSGPELSLPFTTKEEMITSPNATAYNPYAHSFGGMAVQFGLFLGIDAGLSILQQRRRGLWSRLRAAPLSRYLLLGSRAASATITSSMVLLVTFAFARLVFGVRLEGSFIGFLLLALAFGFMTSSYGLLIAALGRSPEATRGLATLVTLMMVMTSGAWIPDFLFPEWLRQITLLTPARWAMLGIDGATWRGLGLQDMATSIGALLGFAAIFWLLALWRFRWEE